MLAFTGIVLPSPYTRSVKHSYETRFFETSQGQGLSIQKRSVPNAYCISIPRSDHLIWIEACPS